MSEPSIPSTEDRGRTVRDLARMPRQAWLPSTFQASHTRSFHARIPPLKITKTGFLGVALIELDPHEDEKGSFCRTWSQETFAALGLVSQFRQGNLVNNSARGTLRGLHYQDSPEGVRVDSDVDSLLALDLSWEPQLPHRRHLRVKRDRRRQRLS